MLKLWFTKTHSYLFYFANYTLSSNCKGHVWCTVFLCVNILSTMIHKHVCYLSPRITMKELKQFLLRCNVKMSVAEMTAKFQVIIWQWTFCRSSTYPLSMWRHYSAGGRVCNPSCCTNFNFIHQYKCVHLGKSWYWLAPAPPIGKLPVYSLGMCVSHS